MRWAVLLLVLAAAAPALADGPPDKHACNTAYEQAQYARRDKHLRTARAQALVCAQEACGSAAQTDCAQWLREIEAAIPTVVFAVRDEQGTNLSRVTVTMDGEQLATTLDGSAIPVDPGKHVFRIASEGLAQTEETMMVQEGDKSRVLEVVLHRASASAVVAPSTPQPQTTTTRGSIVPSVVVGSASLAFIAASVIVGVVAKNDLDNLRSTCAPSCTQSSLDAVELEAGVSDVLLGVGVVGLATSVVMFVLRPVRSGPTLAVRGTSIVLSGTF